MPAPYSPDLRRRALHACAMVEGSRTEIALRFQVSERCLYRWLEQERGRAARRPSRTPAGARRVSMRTSSARSTSSRST